MISVMGVVYLPIIEKPLSLYYKADITHTAENYSYKPGQSGTAFEFYIKRKDAGYERLPFFQSFAIPTLFYSGILIFLNLIWLLVKRKKDPSRTDHLNEPSKKAIKFVLGRKNKKVNIISIILLTGIVIFFVSARAKRFGLGTPDSLIKEIVAPFNPTKMAYSGGDFIWLVEVNRKGNGAVFIENESASSNDSVYISIKCFDLKDSSYSDINSFHLGRKNYQVDAYAVLDEIWIMTRPNHLLVYDANSTETIYKDASSFAEQFDDLRPGINEFYRIDQFGQLLYIEALNGINYYYDFQSKQLVESISELDQGKLDVFKLKKDKGAITNLYSKINGGSFEKRSDFQFIDADVLYQDDTGIIVLHKSDISDEAEMSISHFNTLGKNLWNIAYNELPISSSETSFIQAKLKFECSRYNDQIVLKISSFLQDEGLMSVNYNTGAINWKYSSQDFILK